MFLSSPIPPSGSTLGLGASAYCSITAFIQSNTLAEPTPVIEAGYFSFGGGSMLAWLPMVKESRTPQIPLPVRILEITNSINCGLEIMNRGYFVRTYVDRNWTNATRARLAGEISSNKVSLHCNYLFLAVRGPPAKPCRTSIYNK